MSILLNQQHLHVYRLFLTLTTEIVPLIFSCSVPKVVCYEAPLSAGGVITVRWSYIHTGGHNLTRVHVLYERSSGSTSEDIADLSRTELEISGLPAGEVYIFRVEASNDLGNHSVYCPPVQHLVGE